MGRALNLSQFQHNVTDGTTTVGTSYVVNGSAKAFSTYNQTTVSAESNFNISSLTDVSAGLMRNNFSSSMSNATYNVITSAGSYNHSYATRNASFVDTENFSGAGSLTDGARNSVAINGDLA